MTDGEKNTDEEGYSWWLKLFLVSGVTIVVLCVVLGILLLLSIPFTFFIFEGGYGYLVTCDDYDGELSTGEELREEWVISDNITSYEDIPEDQKMNLSNDTKRELKQISSGWFNAANYSDLSTAEKEVFMDALNSTQVKADAETPPARVSYRGEVYFCDAAYIPEGA